MNEELLTQIEQLREKAAKVIEEMDESKEVLAKYKAQTELLTEQLTELGLDSWEQADDKLSSLEWDMRTKMKEMTDLLNEIGIIW